MCVGFDKIIWYFMCCVVLCVVCVSGGSCASGFEYNERTILGVNAASKWAQELADLNLAAVATPFYKGYKVPFVFCVCALFPIYSGRQLVHMFTSRYITHGRIVQGTKEERSHAFLFFSQLSTLCFHHFFCQF